MTAEQPGAPESSVEAVEDVDEDRGGCEPFVGICPREFADLADEKALSADERYALLWLTLIADYRTGEMNITRAEVADQLGWHKDKSRRVVDELASKGLVAVRFPLGHRGWLAVPRYLDVVHVKPPIARAIGANLDRRRTEARSADPLPSEHVDAEPPLDRSCNGGLAESAERTRPSLGGDSVERTGETPDSVPSEAALAPSASDSSGWGSVPEVTLAALAGGRGIDARATVECPLIGEVELPAVRPGETAVEVCPGVRRRRSRSVVRSENPAGYRLDPEPPAAVEPSSQVSAVEGSLVASGYPMLRPLPAGLSYVPLPAVEWCRECGGSAVTLDAAGPICRKCFERTVAAVPA